jgi:hypothetical protein
MQCAAVEKRKKSK